MKYTRSTLKHNTMRSFKETCLCKFFTFNFINKFVGEIYSVAPIKKVRVKPNLKLWFAQRWSQQYKKETNFMQGKVSWFKFWGWNTLKTTLNKDGKILFEPRENENSSASETQKVLLQTIYQSSENVSICT